MRAACPSAVKPNYDALRWSVTAGAMSATGARGGMAPAALDRGRKGPARRERWPSTILVARKCV
jgi:hypothetical protein